MCKFLTDLSLYNNDISRIEGLAALVSLRFLSLGNNRLASLDDVLELRREVPGIEVLTLEGNPVAAGAARASYRHFTLAFLPWLKYLDNELITRTMVRKAPLPACCY